jgi:DEAD/DEAH box helicase domain-containing protein
VAELLELNEAGNLGIRAFTFDGDTPGDARQAIRTARATSWSRTRTCCTRAILPHHTKWAQFFENLRFVVIDEMHSYRGVFGSHVANVIRRLRRVCRVLRRGPAVHPVLGDHRQPGRTRRRR